MVRKACTKIFVEFLCRLFTCFYVECVRKLELVILSEAAKDKILQDVEKNPLLCILFNIVEYACVQHILLDFFIVTDYFLWDMLCSSIFIS